MRNNKSVEIVNYLKKNTNINNTKNIDEIIENIYTVDNGVFERELEDKELAPSVAATKRRNRRNQLRDTVAKNLSSLIDLEIICCVKRKKKELFGGESEEYIIFSDDEKGGLLKDKWYKNWRFYYNHPFDITVLRALSECVLQLDGTQSYQKLELINKLAICAGENLVTDYIDSLKKFNPNYLAVLTDDEGFNSETKKFAGIEWSKETTYENMNVIDNLNKIYKELEKGSIHCEISFMLINYDCKGNAVPIGEAREYKCFPLYIISADRRFWLVSIMRTENRECGYYENLNFSPLDLMEQVTICKGEEYKLEDYPLINNKEDITKIAVQHQIGGQFFSYETPVNVIFKVKYNERMGRIPFDLINRSFGEDYYVDKENSNADYARIMVVRSPYSIKQWAKVNAESIEIEGFYDHDGNRI